jgi:hypothetical protein
VETLYESPKAKGQAVVGVTTDLRGRRDEDF